MYNRDKAIAYAHEWAMGRNPAYYNFDGQGGDCTNFVSQCLYAGCGVMNYTRDVGWYFISVNDRAAAWSGVEFLHRFLTGNKKAGPYGTQRAISEAVPGDIIQLSYDGVRFGHSVIIVAASPKILCAHHSSINADNRPFSTYLYQSARLIHVEGVNG